MLCLQYWLCLSYVCMEANHLRQRVIVVSWHVKFILSVPHMQLHLHISSRLGTCFRCMQVMKTCSEQYSRFVELCYRELCFVGSLRQLVAWKLVLCVQSSPCRHYLNYFKCIIIYYMARATWVTVFTNGCGQQLSNMKSCRAVSCLSMFALRSIILYYSVCAKARLAHSRPSNQGSLPLLKFRTFAFLNKCMRHQHSTQHVSSTANIRAHDYAQTCVCQGPCRLVLVHHCTSMFTEMGHLPNTVPHLIET